MPVPCRTSTCRPAGRTWPGVPPTSGASRTPSTWSRRRMPPPGSAPGPRSSTSHRRSRSSRRRRRPPSGTPEPPGRRRTGLRGAGVPSDFYENVVHSDDDPAGAGSGYAAVAPVEPSSTGERDSVIATPPGDRTMAREFGVLRVRPSDGSSSPPRRRRRRPAPMDTVPLPPGAAPGQEAPLSPPPLVDAPTDPGAERDRRASGPDELADYPTADADARTADATRARSDVVQALLDLLTETGRADHPAPTISFAELDDQVRRTASLLVGPAALRPQPGLAWPLPTDPGQLGGAMLRLGPDVASFTEQLLGRDAELFK